MAKFRTLGAAIASMPLFATSSLAQAAEMGSWNGPYWGWGHMVGGGITMVLGWGAVIFLLFVLVRALNATHHGFVKPHRTAIEILKERFARGEIDKDEFMDRRKLLEG